VRDTELSFDYTVVSGWDSPAATDPFELTILTSVVARQTFNNWPRCFVQNAVENAPVTWDLRTYENPLEGATKDKKTMKFPKLQLKKNDNVACLIYPYLTTSSASFLWVGAGVGLSALW
jgi:hypothetical protein